MAASTALASHPHDGLDVAVDFPRRTLRLSGDVDSATAPILLSAADILIARAVGDLTIDLAGVTFADSGLLHALLDIRTDLRNQGAGLWLVNESSCVKRLFLASGFRAVLER